MQTFENRLVKTEWMSERDKQLYRDFCKDAQLKQIGERRMEKYRTDLCIANTMSGKDLLGMVGSLPNLQATIAKINASKEYSFESKKDCKRTLGSLFNFLHHKERSLKFAGKEIKELITHRAKPGDKRLAKPTISRDEVRDMMQYGNTQQRALIFLLYESGMRIGEICQMRKSNILQIEEGLEIKVPAGKTGERRVVVVEAAQYVNTWLGQHPIKKRDAFLFPQERHIEQPIGGAGITKHIHVVVGRMNAARKEQGIPPFTKPHNPHNFRHSRATELGGEAGMTEQIMCKVFGWELDSAMPKTYIHLTDEQVKRAVLRTYGRAKPDEEKKIITHKTCPKCHEENPISLYCCGRCGYDLEANKMPSKIEQLEARLAKLEGERKDKIRAAIREKKAKP